MKYLSDRIDHFLPYCVYITIYRGNQLPPFYIGSTSVEKIGKGYRGSVSSKDYKKIWRDEILNSPHLFNTIIISTHETKAGARDRETWLQIKLKSTYNSLYVNMAHWTRGHTNVAPLSGVNHPNYGRRKPQHVKDNMSRLAKKRVGKLHPRYGAKTSEETKAKISTSLKTFYNHNPKLSKQHSEHTKRILSIKAKERYAETPKVGIPLTQETKDKISRAKKGRTAPNKGIPCKAETKSKIALALSNKVNQYSREGKFIRSWNSFKQAADFYNVNITSISNAAKNPQKRRSCGFIWVKASFL